MTRTPTRQDQIRWMTMPELQARVVVLETALQALLDAKALKTKRGRCQKYVLAKTKAWALARQAMGAAD